MKVNKDNFEIIVKTFQGLEDVLIKEIKNLGVDHVEKKIRAVSFIGNNELLYKANLNLRTALTILKPIAQFKVRDDFNLYKKVQQIDWSTYMSYRDTLFVGSTVYSDYFKHSKYVIYKTKDAIVDQFMEKNNKRPNINLENPTLKIDVHIVNDNCTISLDSSGKPLNQRGYRLETNEAPINEVLAAGLILLSNWEKDSSFIDPMCGSGTIPIEAAMIANNIAPNINRQHFGFFNWKDFNKAIWTRIHEEALNNEIRFKHKIYGYDKSPRAIRISKKNLAESKMRDKVIFEVRDFEELEPPKEKGMLIINPPYNERLQNIDVESFYEMIGDRFKQKFTGYDACILSANIDAIKKVGLRTSFKIHLNNGGLKCKYHKYQIYKGSKKNKF